MSFTLRENTISSVLLYIHITEIPTNKGHNSYKLKISKIGNSALPAFWITLSGTSFLSPLTDSFPHLLVVCTILLYWVWTAYSKVHLDVDQCQHWTWNIEPLLLSKKKETTVMVYNVLLNYVKYICWLEQTLYYVLGLL